MLEPEEVLQYPLVDSEQFQALVVTGEDKPSELILELLQLFHEEVDKRLKDMQDAIDAEDISSIQAQAHALAGCSSNIGGRRFSEVNRAILRACKKRDLKAIQRLSADLGDHYADTRFALLRRLNDLEDSGGSSVRVNG